MPTKKPTKEEAAKRESAHRPSKDDTHEQREPGQRQEAVVTETRNAGKVSPPRRSKH